MLRKILFGLVCLHLAWNLTAQNDIQYSQFIFNKLAINPAYAGNRDALTVGAIYRNQWTGVEGAPKTVSAYMHAPFMGERNGLGFSLTNDQIGLYNNSFAELSYAYRIPLEKGHRVAIGIKTRFEHNRFNNSQIEVIDTNDGSIPDPADALTSLNFGAGGFYQAPNWYVGVSVPLLLKTTLYSDQFFGQSEIRDFRSYYLMGGLIVELNDQLLFKPAALISYNPNAPFELDLNASFYLVDAIWIGATYRLGDSVDGVVQYQFSPQLKVGLGFDFTTSELSQFSSGTFEILTEYTFQYDKENVNNIRFF